MSQSIRSCTIESVLPTLPDSAKQAWIEGQQRVYTVDLKDGQVFHHERMFDQNGDEIYDDSVAIDFEVGSGSKAIAYISQRDHLLYMSPLNWYRSKGWDFAPEHSAEDPRRFSRRVNDDCLSCHAGRVNLLDSQPCIYESPPFREQAISCENCHGPGKQHVAYHQTASPDFDDDMVKIATLDHQRREAICYQCHLHAPVRLLRPGRSNFDFRPGQRLEDVWVFLLDNPSEQDPSHDNAIGQVQQMFASQCYQSSAGRLGCTSCHDPHTDPKPEERTSIYRQACISCHDSSDCLAPWDERASVDNSCFVCHMPSKTATNVAHVSLTDHRIIRPKAIDGSDAIEKRAERIAVTAKGANTDLVFLWDTQSRLPNWEQKRAMGMGLWLAGSRSTGRPPTQIAELLRPIAEAFPGDGAVQTVLGAFYSEYRMLDRARFHYEAALSDPAAHENALSNLINVYYLASEWKKVLQLSETLLNLDRQNARIYALRADAFLQLGMPNEAIEAAELGLRFNPTLQPLRSWLIQTYLKTNNELAAKKHIDLYQRIQNPKVPEGSLTESND